MTIPLMARLAVDLASAIFALTGLIHLSGSTHMRAVYRLWHYPHHFFRIVGIAGLMVALFLIVPETRFWGLTGGVLSPVAVEWRLFRHAANFLRAPATVCRWGSASRPLP